MKYLLIAATLFVGSALNLSAQLADRLVPHFGITQEVIVLREQVVLPGSTPSEARAAFTMLNFGTYAVLAHKNDIVSVGVDASGQVGLRIVGGGYVDFSAQTPIYLMGKVGAGSTPYNDQMLGFGAGIGANTWYFNITTNSGRASTFALLPAAVAQVRINTPGTSLTGRFHTSLAPVASKLSTKLSSGATTESMFDVSFFGFGLVYEF